MKAALKEWELTGILPMDLFSGHTDIFMSIRTFAKQKKRHAPEHSSIFR
jgi:hypothetical protein